MLKTPVLVCAISAWGYEGFVGDPAAPAVNGPSANVSKSSRATPPPPPAAAPSRAVKPGPAQPPRSPRAKAVKPTPRAEADPPTIWRLTDVTGQTWEHVDPAWLRSWVESRNRAAPCPALGDPLPGVGLSWRDVQPTALRPRPSPRHVTPDLPRSPGRVGKDHPNWPVEPDRSTR